jgi:intein-encoded DNA endonuclease-like protein
MPIFKTVDLKFFKKWNPGMAYVLGFFTADGNMIKNRRGACFIDFQTIDRKLLERIRELLGSNHKINAKKRSDKWQIRYRLQIGSRAIFYDLLKLGLVPNKGKRIVLPNVPQKYLSHFVRGYFDGDGHVAIASYTRKDRKNKKTKTILSGFTSSNKEFLKSLHYSLKKFARLIGGSLFYNKGYRLSFSVNDTLALYRFIYKGKTDNLYLKRKKKIFEKYFKLGQ